MITFVTGNSGKFQDFQTELGLYGLAGRQATLRLIEPQEADLTEIARAKARQAHAALQCPLVVEDSGLCIPALNDFPAALTKPVLEQVGLAGFLTMLAGIDDRRCFFRCALAWVDATGTMGVITSEHESGILRREAAGGLTTRARSALWQIFQPDGFDKVMAEMDEAELAQLFTSWRAQNTFRQFAALVRKDAGRFGLSAAA